MPAFALTATCKPWRKAQRQALVEAAAPLCADLEHRGNDFCQGQDRCRTVVVGAAPGKVSPESKEITRRSDEQRPGIASVSPLTGWRSSTGVT